MKRRNTVAKTGLLLMGLLLAYTAYVTRNGPTRELTPVGMLFLYPAILATLATMFVAARRAHRADRPVWMLASVFFWPAAYVYALWVDREGTP